MLGDWPLNLFRASEIQVMKHRDMLLTMEMKTGNREVEKMPNPEDDKER
jgi:hypothetical protein